MSLRPFVKLFRNHQLSALLGISRLFKPFYKLVYLAGARECGLLELLSEQPLSFDRLADAYCSDTKSREALEAWLQLGIRLGYLEGGGGGYALKGLARELAAPRNDAAIAMVQEVARLHYKLIADTPSRLRNRQLWTLEDQDGEVIARSSRLLENFQTEALDRTFPASGAIRLLEIGCGSAVYIQYAAQRNPALTAVGLELQPDVAVGARRNIAEWGLQQRVSIEIGDIRDRKAQEQFDVVTLYNNIYYFPFEERVALLRRLKESVKPGGFLLLTTCCQGGSLGLEVLNLWGAATATGGRLPRADEMAAQLREAGFGQVESMSLVPGDSFHAFKAMNA